MTPQLRRHADDAMAAARRTTHAGMPLVLLLVLVLLGVPPGAVAQTNDTDTDGEVENVGTADFVVSLIINLILAAIFFLVFCHYRRKDEHVYSYRRTLKTGAPPPMAPGFLQWIGSVLSYSDEQVFRDVGLDALVMLRFLRLGYHVFVCISLYGLIVLLPIYITADNGQEGFNVLSMSNLVSSDSRLWASWVSAYINSFIVFYFVHKEYHVWSEFRIRYMRTGAPHFRSVLVQSVPPEDRSDAKVRAYFERIHHGVDSVQMAYQVGELSSLVEERDAVALKLERAYWEIEHNKELFEAMTDAKKAKQNNEPRRPLYRIPKYDKPVLKWLPIGEKVDAAEYYEHRLEALNKEVELLQARYTDYFEPTEAACVSFDTLRAASIAAQCVHDARPRRWVVSSAPEARDIYWPNLAMSWRDRETRRILVNVAVFALVMFWTIPITFVSALTTLENLSNISAFSWLDGVANLNPAIRGFLQGFLPTLALVIFMALLPLIMLVLSKVEGMWSMSMLQSGVFEKLFYFEVVDVFFISLIAGSAFAELQRIIDAPGEIINLLGQSIPRTGNFFINYVMLLSLSSFMLQLSQIPRKIVTWIKRKWLAKTPREKEMAGEPEPYAYGAELPGMVLVFLLGLVYATANPLILPFMIVYFALGSLVLRQQLGWVFVKAFESGGLLWTSIFARIMVALLVYQFTMIGLMGVKRGGIQSVLLIPLPLMTIYLWLYCNREIKPKVLYLPLSEADAKPLRDGIDEDISRDPRAMQHPDLRKRPYLITSDVPALVDTDEEVQGRRPSAGDEEVVSEARRKFEEGETPSKATAGESGMELSTLAVSRDDGAPAADAASPAPEVIVAGGNGDDIVGADVAPASEPAGDA